MVREGRWKIGATAILLSLPLGACGGDGDDGSTETATRPLEAVCAETPEAVPEDAWICGEDRQVECESPEGAHVELIHVVGSESGGAAGTEPDFCPERPLQVSDEGPFPVGEHEIVVYRPALFEGGEPAEVCRSRLTVVDSAPPVVTPRTVELWPPNHRLHTITPEDCVAVEDACDADVRVVFTHATSDEPPDGRGDGHHAPDIVDLGCDGVKLRAERSGPGDGRVYTLGWRAEDDAGNVAEGTCRVVVPHDQSGREAVAGEPAYEVLPDPSACPAPAADQ